MNKPLKLLFSIIVAAGLIGGAFMIRQRSASTTDEQKITPPAAVLPAKVFTAESLAEYNGQDGKECYVAVDGKVYEIEQGLLWNNGSHTTSEGQASCGRDLSEAIKQSPHGKSKLTTLTIVGTYQTD